MVDKGEKISIENREKNNNKKKTARKVSNQSKVQGKKQKTRKKQADVKSARAKKSLSTRKILNWTILIGIIIGIIVFLCKSELFKICNIEITGNSQISQEVILELSKIKAGDNIFLSNTIKSQKQISENPYVKEVTIKRILPDKIKIEIVEKEKKYMLQLDENYAYADKNGDVLEISSNKVPNLITLVGYYTSKEGIRAGSSLGEEDLERIGDIQKILNSAEKNGIHDKIENINIEDENNYILNLPSCKKIVYVGNTTNLATKMLRAKDIIDKTTEKEGKIFVNGNFNEGFDPYFREESNN